MRGVTPTAHTEGARLTGAPLALARAAWIVTAVVSVGLIVVAMPLAYQQIITPQTGPQCADSRFSPAQFAYMHATGISPTSLAVVVIVVLLSDQKARAVLGSCACCARHAVRDHRR